MTLLTLLGAESPADLDLLYKPVRDQIARLLRARTDGKYGGELREFTDTTNPTADEVDKLIDDAAALVAGEVGVDLPEQTWAIARRVVALHTVLLIEAGSEQINTARYDRFERMLFGGASAGRGQLAMLVDAVQDARAGGDPGQVDDRPAPLGTFPCPEPLDW